MSISTRLLGRVSGVVRIRPADRHRRGGSVPGSGVAPWAVRPPRSVSGWRPEVELGRRRRWAGTRGVYCPSAGWEVPGTVARPRVMASGSVASTWLSGREVAR